MAIRVTQVLWRVRDHFDHVHLSFLAEGETEATRPKRGRHPAGGEVAAFGKDLEARYGVKVTSHCRAVGASKVRDSYHFTCMALDLAGPMAAMDRLAADMRAAMGKPVSPGGGGGGGNPLNPFAILAGAIGALGRPVFNPEVARRAGKIAAGTLMLVPATGALLRALGATRAGRTVTDVGLSVVPGGKAVQGARLARQVTSTR